MTTCTEEDIMFKANPFCFEPSPNTTKFNLLALMLERSSDPRAVAFVTEIITLAKDADARYKLTQVLLQKKFKHMHFNFVAEKYCEIFNLLQKSFVGSEAFENVIISFSQKILNEVGLTAPGNNEIRFDPEMVSEIMNIPLETILKNCTQRRQLNRSFLKGIKQYKMQKYSQPNFTSARKAHERSLMKQGIIQPIMVVQSCVDDPDALVVDLDWHKDKSIFPDEGEPSPKSALLKSELIANGSLVINNDSSAEPEGEIALSDPIEQEHKEYLNSLENDSAENEFKELENESKNKSVSVQVNVEDNSALEDNVEANSALESPIKFIPVPVTEMKMRPELSDDEEDQIHFANFSASVPEQTLASMDRTVVKETVDANMRFCELILQSMNQTFISLKENVANATEQADHVNNWLQLNEYTISSTCALMDTMFKIAGSRSCSRFVDQAKLINSSEQLSTRVLERTRKILGHKFHVSSNYSSSLANSIAEAGDFKCTEAELKRDSICVKSVQKVIAPSKVYRRRRKPRPKKKKPQQKPKRRKTIQIASLPDYVNISETEKFTVNFNNEEYLFKGGKKRVYIPYTEADIQKLIDWSKPSVCDRENVRARLHKKEFKTLIKNGEVVVLNIKQTLLQTKIQNLSAITFVQKE